MFKGFANYLPRKSFVLSSAEYLFRSTFQCNDLTLATLLDFLNCAMPPEKYEEFDSLEVIRAISFGEHTRFVLEGNTVKRG